MRAAVELIREVEGSGALITIEGEQLKLIRGKLLPAHLLDEMRSSKAQILGILKQEQKAKEAGFLSLHIGEVYERQIAVNSHIFLIRNESGKWDAWRETWSRGKVQLAQSISSKSIADNVSFELVLVKTAQYIGTLARWRGRVSA